MWRDDGGLSRARIGLRPATAEDRRFLVLLQESLEAPRVTPAVAARHYDECASVLSAAYPDADSEIVCEHGVPVGRMLVWQGDGVVWLLDMSIVPPARGRGIGTAVMRGLLDRCRGSGNVLRLHVEAENRRAHAFYARLGFERVECDSMYDEMVWTPPERRQP